VAVARPRLRRYRLIALVVACVAVFLAISAVLARVFSADGAEQSAVTALLREEARGDAPAMAKAIKGCSASAACEARVARDAADLKRPGHVSILQYTQSTGFSLGSTVGTARVAWEVVDETKPIVQCVRVRRAGNALSGITIELLEISLRIRGDADCPGRAASGP
jgi:hypothetical protein